MERLKEEVINLTQMITELNANKLSSEEKLKEMDSLEDFLMQREGYICKIHELPCCNVVYLKN